jgi:hypothetical protein
MRGLVALAAMLLTASCAGTPIINNSDISPGYRPGEYRAGGPEMTVIVRGNPFALPQGAFDAAVVDAIQGVATGAVVHFVPGEVPLSTYRIVMVFDPAGNASGPVLCRRPGPPPMPTAAPAGVPVPARISLVAALCRADQEMTLASGSVGVAGGPQGDEFRGGLVQFGRALFPFFNPQDLPGNEPPF